MFPRKNMGMTLLVKITLLQSKAPKKQRSRKQIKAAFLTGNLRVQEVYGRQALPAPQKSSASRSETEGIPRFLSPF
jgi:hypothetical protein